MKLFNIKILNHYNKVIYSSRQYWFNSRKPINVIYHIQKEKNHMIICIYSEKSFHKI